MYTLLCSLLHKWTNRNRHETKTKRVLSSVCKLIWISLSRCVSNFYSPISQFTSYMRGMTRPGSLHGFIFRNSSFGEMLLDTPEFEQIDAQYSYCISVIPQLMNIKAGTSFYYTGTLSTCTSFYRKPVLDCSMQACLTNDKPLFAIANTCKYISSKIA